MTTTDDPAGALVVRRLIPVPRELVFAAWLDPASLARWMCPGSVTGATVDVDPRVGGAFRIVMHGQGDTEHWGEYLIVEPPSLLSFKWISVNTNFEPTLVTVEFHERDGGTEVILTHRQLPPAQLDPHTKGWSDILRKLEEAVESFPPG
jgi:uncharacterized protein YndB with AHSA1/START domain